MTNMFPFHYTLVLDVIPVTLAKKINLSHVYNHTPKGMLKSLQPNPLLKITLLMFDH